MSRVHRRLHDPSSVDQPIGDYLRALCMDLIQTSDTPGIHLAVRTDPVTFNLETLMSVSLIVAELVTNSLKHAFQGRDEGEISITVSLAGGTDDARQPVLLTTSPDAPNLARNMLIADGSWRDSALSYDRAFFMFDTATLEDARAAWRSLAGREGVERHYWAREDGKWVEKGSRVAREEVHG